MPTKKSGYTSGEKRVEEKYSNVIIGGDATSIGDVGKISVNKEPVSSKLSAEDI
jgi:hypothetical protein